MNEEVCDCDGPDCEICFMTENDNLEEDDPDAEDIESDI